MKLSLNWIKEFTDIKLDNDELIRRIGSQLGSIDEVEDWSAYFDERIVVAEITKAEAHPDADKLGTYEITTGNNKLHNLVAGDKTLKPGDKVGYIPPGVAVPQSIKQGEPFEVGKRDIRGKTSEGMLGSAKELLFGDDHEQVMKLDTDKGVGTSLIEAYQLDDLIIDIENKMFTHRPDLFGMLGLAREIAGIQELSFSSPDWYVSPANLADGGSLSLSVDNQIPEGCPRFVAVALSGVTIMPSPLMMQTMLMRLGVRPINNVVDATNFSMMLTAQPSHAFDYDKVAELSSGSSAQIVVRNAEKDEKIQLLDGREITLRDSDMVVATDKHAISVAGAMGGGFTEVSDSTKNVILEVASWDLFSIRRTSFAHGIFTDAVTRFNKGQSPTQCDVVLKYTAELLKDNADATPSSALIDEHSRSHKEAIIQLPVDFANVRLGASFSAQQLAEILNNVEIVSSAKTDSIEAKVPFWRTDLHLAEDLVEEVGRLHGYDNLPIELPTRQSYPNLRSDELRLKSTVRASLAQAGAQEVLTYNFVSSKLFEQAGYDQALVDSAYRIRNSLSPELAYMRIALSPSLLSKVNQNMRSGYEEFALFEVNKSHNNQELGDDKLPLERTSVSFVYTTKQSDGQSPYFVAKRYLEQLASDLGVEVSFRQLSANDDNNPWAQSLIGLFAANRVAVVEVNGRLAGLVGEYDSRTKRSFKLNPTSAGFEVDIATFEGGAKSYQALSRYPKLSQDITLETPDDMTYKAVYELVKGFVSTSNVVNSIEPISIYRGEAGDRRISLRIHFVSHERTLKTNEVNELISSLVAELATHNLKQI